MNRRRAGRWFVVAAGAADALTGLGLLAAPGRLLAPLGLSAPAGDDFALRFVGLFVTCVGLAYLYPFALSPERRAARLAAVIEWTAGVRLAVAGFMAVAVASGRPSGWLVVGFFDAAVALTQLALCAGGCFDAG